MKRLSRTSKALWLILGLIIFIQIGYMVYLVRSFQQSFQQSIWSNARTAGENIKGNLDYILGVGVDINHLVGLEKLLQGVLNDAPFLEFLAIQAEDGPTLYYCDRQRFLQGEDIKKLPSSAINPDPEMSLSFPLIDSQGHSPGALTVEIDSNRLEQAVNEIRLDTGTVVIISLLVIFDFLFFSVAYIMTIPLRRASDEINMVDGDGLLDLPITRTGVDFLDLTLDEFDAFRKRFLDLFSELGPRFEKARNSLIAQGMSSDKVEDLTEAAEDVLTEFKIIGEKAASIPQRQFPELIRPAVFLFVFAESLSMSFLPLYAEEIYRPLWNLPKNVVLGLPISVFMFFLGISLPLGGAWSDRVGRKKVFLLGSIITSIGLVLSGFATDVVWLIVFRAVTAIGFGMDFMTCQGYIIDSTNDYHRARGMALFIAAFYGGALCGSAIGGMLAEHLGFRILFFVGGGISLISAGFMYKFVTENFQKQRVKLKKLGSRGWMRLLSDRNFMALVLFQSIPSKIILIGLVYYAAPLFLKELGNSQSDIGRVVMGYSLVMIIFSPILSRYADRRKDVAPFVFWGGVFSGCALVPLFFWPATIWVALGIVLLGLSHSFSVSSQAKITTQLEVVREVGVGGGFGVYRLLERIGNVAAPLIMGILVSSLGYSDSLVVLGGYVILSSLMFGLIFKRPKVGQ